MQINASFDFAADTPQAERNNYVNAVNTVIGYFNALFSNDVTINVKFALGERLLSTNGNAITYERMADINTPGSLLGASNTQYDIFDYATVRNRLLTKTDTNQPAAYPTLPAVSPFGNDTFIFPVAEAKALGFTSALSLAGYDGVVGTISEEELAPGGATADWTKAAPANGNQYYMIGSIEHELTEIMGRFARDGTTFLNSPPLYTIMDLFRYAAPGVRQTTNGDPAYFSIDNGNHFYYYWNTDLAAGDLGDWIQFAPGGTPPGADPFNLFEDPGVINEISAFDLVNMNVLGWNLVPVVKPNPPPPAGTTADMILRRGSDGFYEIYDIGNNAILAGYLVGQVGTTWQFAGLGGFFGSDTTDMLLRNSTTGGFEVYDISNNNITNAAFLGNVGMDWRVMGFGNFSSMPGETDMILRNSNTGGVEVYDIRNNQITGAAFMGAVGLNWQFSGVGNFSSVPGESDLLLRNVNTGGLLLYDIVNNQITGAFFLGNVGLDWQFAGVAPVSAPGASDLVLRNFNTGAFQVYNIAGNTLVGSAGLGAPGPDWQLGGFAASTPTGSIGSSGAPLDSTSQPAAMDGSTSQLVQAMAGFGGGSGAGEGLNNAPLGADTSQQQFLTTPHA